MARLVERALVMDGSIAGLIVARVLSGYFAQVTILERDQIKNDPAVHKSIAQGNHVHALPQGGQQVLSSLYSGFSELDSRDGIDGIAASFFAKAAEVNQSPWSLAAGFDFAYPQTSGKRSPNMAQAAQYFAKIDRLQLDDL